MRRRELAQSGLKPATTGPAASVLQQSGAEAAKLHVSSFILVQSGLKTSTQWPLLSRTETSRVIYDAGCTCTRH